jgi:hypothetical protein
MKHDQELQIVLAIHATARGFGWVVFEGRYALIDWGMREARGDKNRESVAKVAKVMKWYKPDVLVVEDAVAGHSRRDARIKQLHRQLAQLATSSGIETKDISRSDVKGVFATRHAKTRHEIAIAISEEFPQLVPWMPSPRNIWAAEERRLSIFDAAALAIAFFELNEARA